MDDLWTYDVIRTGPSCTIELFGEIDMSVREEVLAVMVAEVNRPDTAAVSLDMGAVSFLDSSGLEALVKAKHAADAHGCGFAVVGAKGSALRALEITDLLTYLNGEPTRSGRPRHSPGAPDRHAL